jgi:hypothetical protein
MAKLISYKVKWNLDSHTGQIDIKLGVAGPANPHAPPILSTLYPQTPEEMHMLVDLLRNEKPIDYISVTKELRLGEWEIIGEGET